MNSYPKNKRSVLNLHNTTRINTRLNKHNGIAALYDRYTADADAVLESDWIEQASEMKSGHCPVNQTPVKKHKLIIRWWEN